MILAKCQAAMLGTPMGQVNRTKRAHCWHRSRIWTAEIEAAFFPYRVEHTQSGHVETDRGSFPSCLSLDLI